VIEHVVHLRAELEPRFFPNREILEQREVRVVDARSTENIARRVAEIANAWRGKGSRIEPFREAAGATVKNPTLPAPIRAMRRRRAVITVRKRDAGEV
jgi:hypothetical protein